MKTAFKVGILAGVFALGACTAYDPYYHTKVGAVTGGVAGGVIGHQLDDDNGRYYGAAAGALLGGSVGNQMDQQQRYYDQRLEEQRRYNEAELRRYYDGGYYRPGYRY